MSERPPFIVSAQFVPERSHSYPHSEEKMGPMRMLGRAAGLQRLGINLQTLPPGTRSSWPTAGPTPCASPASFTSPRC